MKKSKEKPLKGYEIIKDYKIRKGKKKKCTPRESPRNPVIMATALRLGSPWSATRCPQASWGGKKKEKHSRELLFVLISRSYYVYGH